jgi:hypothetical protein
MGFVVSPVPNCEGPGAPAVAQDDRIEWERRIVGGIPP